MSETAQPPKTLAEVIQWHKGERAMADDIGDGRTVAFHTGVIVVLEPPPPADALKVAVEAFKQFYDERSIFLNHGLDSHLDEAMAAALATLKAT